MEMKKRPITKGQQCVFQKKRKTTNLPTIKILGGQLVNFRMCCEPVSRDKGRQVMQGISKKLKVAKCLGTTNLLLLLLLLPVSEQIFTKYI
jgi:hypothetical protein